MRAPTSQIPTVTRPHLTATSSKPFASSSDAGEDFDEVETPVASGHGNTHPSNAVVESKEGEDAAWAFGSLALHSTSSSTPGTTAVVPASGGEHWKQLVRGNCSNQCAALLPRHTS